MLQDTTSVARDVLESLEGSRWLHVKPTRVATTRWGSWHDAVQSNLLPHFHEKLLVLMALGLEQGWLSRTSEGAVSAMQELRPRDVANFAKPKDGGEDKGTKSGEAKLAKLRDSCKNALHVAAMAMSEPTFYFDLWLVSYGSLPFRRWHGEVAHKVRDSDASELFWTGLAMQGLQQQRNTPRIPLLVAKSPLLGKAGRVSLGTLAMLG